MKIYTELTNKEIEEALLGDVRTMWEVVSSLEGDKSFEREIMKVKMGIDIEFDIRSIIEDLYEIEPAFNLIRIERKHKINLVKYRDEMDNRKKIMKNILRELYNPEFDKQREPTIHGYKD